MFRFLAISLVLLICASCDTRHYAGMSKTVIRSESHRDIHLTIWYPTEQTNTVEVTGNAVFMGQQAVVDAAPLAGQRPLVLLSHGGFRSARDSGAWLSARLAQSGFIAVEVNSPNLSNPSFALREIQIRAEDVRMALDYLYSDDTWNKRIDPNYVVAAGFALGGTVALRLVGAQMDSDLTAATCDSTITSESIHPDCDWLNAILENISEQDHRSLEAAVEDSRIDGAVAIGPDFASALVQQSLPTPKDTHIIELGPRSNIPMDWGDTDHSYIPSSTPTDGFPLCRLTAIKLLAESGENPEICFNLQSQRDIVHHHIYEIVTRFVISRSHQGSHNE